MSARRPRTGTVVDFDADRGLGAVRDDAGDVIPFHCTALVDGSRSVAVGTRVTFVTAAGHRGLIEARGLVRLQQAAG